MVRKPYGTKKFGSLKCNTIPLQWITLLLNLIVAITYNLLACYYLLPAKCRTSNLLSQLYVYGVYLILFPISISLIQKQPTTI